jgi:hypothetical protein
MLEVPLHLNVGVKVADPLVERRRALEMVNTRVTSRIAMPSVALITSERKKSRKVCVISSRLPDKDGVK